MSQPYFSMNKCNCGNIFVPNSKGLCGPCVREEKEVKFLTRTQKKIENKRKRKEEKLAAKQKRDEERRRYQKEEAIRLANLATI